MQRKHLSLSIVLFLSFLTGCIESPESPISAIPVILIDHIEETEETKAFVHGIDDHLYSNITIQINEEKITENFTYQLHLSTSLRKFVMNVSVWHEEKQYEYRGNFTLLRDDGQITLEIEDFRHKDPVEGSLPYTIIMERKE
ncbi:MAG: hypothetical protein V3U20_07715 [Thermoplasmata archaeon]